LAVWLNLIHRATSRLHSYPETAFEEVIEPARRSTWTTNAAGSTGRSNSIQCIDSAMLPAGEPSVWLYSVKT